MKEKIFEIGDVIHVPAGVKIRLFDSNSDSLVVLEVGKVYRRQDAIDSCRTQMEKSIRLNTPDRPQHEVDRILQEAFPDAEGSFVLPSGDYVVTQDSYEGDQGIHCRSLSSSGEWDPEGIAIQFFSLDEGQKTPFLSKTGRKMKFE